MKHYHQFNLLKQLEKEINVEDMMIQFKQLLNGNGLQKIMEGVHIVALIHVIGVTRDEAKLNRFVLGTYLSCKLNAVHSCHLDVQEKEVKVTVLGKIEKKGFRRGISLDMELDMPRLGVEGQLFG